VQTAMSGIQNIILVADMGSGSGKRVCEEL